MSRKDSMQTAVIILTYNGIRYLPDLFASIGKTAFPVPWRLYIVDNGSTDGTREWLASRIWPLASGTMSPTIVLNDENLGFAGGNNVGITRAMADGAEYVVLLNQDTVVDPQWLTRLVAAAESDPRIGAVQARLMYAQDHAKINSLGNEIHFLGFGFSRGNGSRWPGATSEQLVADITYPSGAAVLLRTNALRDVGLLDDSLFMYHDDLDLGWRLWRAGWRCVLAPDAVVYHHYEFSRSIKKFYLMERNRWLVLLENMRIRTLFVIAPALFFLELGMLPYGMLKGWGWQKLRATAFFLRPSTWSLIAQKRREKQATFRSPESALLARFVGTITDQEVANPIITYIVNPLFSLYWRGILMLIH